LQNPSWENTEVIHDTEALKKLKITVGPDLQVYGSANLVQTLMEHNLVDEFWLKIFPLTLGSGKRLFQFGTIPTSFKLFNSKVTPNGIVFVYYKRAGEVKIADIAD